MWGEFEDDANTTTPETEVVIPGPSKNCESVNKNVDKGREESVLSLRDRIIHYMAASTIVLKSQQRYEPDLTYEERKKIVDNIIDEKPGQFLYRFGKHLEREHLQYFIKYEGDVEVDHYLCEALKYKNQHTSKITVRNRRYAAMRKLCTAGDYFSEKEMEHRDPLLYDQLVGKHQTQGERDEKYSVDHENIKFSTLLLHHFDVHEDERLKKQMREQENEMVEEEEENEGDTEKENSEDEEMDSQLESEEKQLLKKEFFSIGYSNFLRGKDEDIDYRQIDTSDDYDLLDIRERDEEERYFDEDDNNSVSGSREHCDDEHMQEEYKRT